MDQPDIQQQNSVEITSFTTRAANVVTAPGELYSEIASAPVQNTSWLIPYLMLVVMAGMMVFSIRNNPVLYDGIVQEQRAELQKKVDAREMEQAQADRAAEFLNNPAMFLALGILFGTLAITGVLFLIPLILTGLSKWTLGYAGGYRKMLEVYGITNIISVAGTLVTMIMMNLLNSPRAQPGGAFFLQEIYDKENFVHNLLASMNIFTIWQVALVGLGISAVSGKKSGAGMALAFGAWGVWVLISSSMGWGAR